LRALSRQRSNRLVLWLVLTSVLSRALIPAGFMPNVHRWMHQGGLLVICPHGDLVTHKASGGSASTSEEQCPFGAAAAAALPSSSAVRTLVATPDGLLVELSVVNPEGTSSHLQPPPRGPPVSL
jgi:hypothetical protein